MPPMVLIHGLLAAAVVCAWEQPPLRICRHATTITSSFLAAEGSRSRRPSVHREAAVELNFESSDASPDEREGRTRRQLFRRAAAFVAAAGAAACGGPERAAAYDPNLTLERSVYLILRVQEATQQETRLVTSGKFKDLQRANIKAAAKMMLRNYQFEDCVIKAATGVKDKSKIQEASDAGTAAVEALNQINEYFDASDNSLQVNFVAPDKLKFIVKALKTSSDNIDRFMAYLPPALVEATKAQIEEENNLNKLEYKAPDGSAEYLNPAPESSQPSKAASLADASEVTKSPPPSALVPAVEKNIAPTPKAPNPEQAKDEIAELELKLEQMRRVKEAARAAAN